MNKKAFTFIELLTVLVILSILLTISVPTISSIINNSYNNTYASNVKLLERSAMLYVEADGIELAEGETRIDLNTLVFTKYVSEIKDPKNKSQNCDGYVIANKNNNGVIYSGYLSCGDNYQTPNYNEELVNVKPPIITINGSATITMGVGDSYIDLGATASDEIDGDITLNILTVTNINTNVIGSYSVTYSVVNSNGIETTASRNVNVIDLENPVLTINGGTRITININEQYEDAGATAYDYIDGDITNRIVTTGTVNTSTVGIYQIVYSVVDDGGNEVTANRVIEVIATGMSKQLTDKDIVTSGSGLYMVNHYNENYILNTKYIYRGTPNNYVHFNNSLWRVVSVEADHSIKMILDERIDTTLQKWSTNSSNVYENSSIKSYLNNYFTTNFTNIAKLMVLPKKFCIGSQISNTNPNENLNNNMECINTTNEEKIGLLQINEYVNASLYSTCNRLYANDDSRVCKNNNYLYKAYHWWSMTKKGGSTTYVWRVSGEGDPRNYLISEVYYVRPVIYLKPQNEIIAGDGTKLNPYVIQLGGYIDEIAPTITLFGDENTNTVIGETYTDSGASAIDDIDGNITQSIDVTSNLNVNVLGTYQIVYTVSDSSGNTASKTRNVTVIPKDKLSSLKTKDLTTTGNGIYEVIHYDVSGGLMTKYIYRGTPNNYLLFANKMWRIIAIEADNTARIILDEGINAQNMQFNTVSSNNYLTSSIKTYLDQYFNNNANFSVDERNMVIAKKRCIATQPSSTSNTNLNGAVECSVLTPNPEKIGLLQINEYVNASLYSTCNRLYANDVSRVCKNNNYLYKAYHWWSITKSSTNTTHAWRISSEGDPRNYDVTSSYMVRPVIYITSDAYIINGNGTVNNPYQISIN